MATDHLSVLLWRFSRPGRLEHWVEVGSLLGLGPTQHMDLVLSKVSRPGYAELRCQEHRNFD